jgi:hypothetical protein
VETAVEERKDEAEVARHGCLTSQDDLDVSLDRQVVRVDLVVEGDDLVAELDVLCSERIDGAADAAEHDHSHLLELRFERVQLGLKLDSHPNRPVT